MSDKPFMNINLSVSLMIILALALAPIGCATAPVTENPSAKAATDNSHVSSGAEKYDAEAEKSATKAAMDKAVSSDAEKYAAADMDTAKEIWKTAEAKMKEEKFVEAKQSYFAAKAAFDMATYAAEGGKKSAVAEASTAVANLEKVWENLKSTAKNVKNKIKDKEMKNDWAAFTKTFTEDIKATKEKIVTDPAGAKSNINELMSIIERWDAAFKGLSAPSTSKTAKPKAKSSNTLKK